MTLAPPVSADTRRRVVVTAPDAVEIQTDARPALADGEALVELLVSGLCGSDKAGAHGVHAFFKPPYFPGHEVVGRVSAVAPGVDSVALGQRVTVRPTLDCGDCKPCNTGRSNLCENLEFFGCGFREGGMSDVFAVRADRLHVIPDTFTDLQAAMIEPLATPVHAVRLAGDLTGKTVVVLGSGTIGLLTQIAARHAGARVVIGTDVRQVKRDVSLRLGADAVLDAAREDLAAAVRAELGESADVVFDCVSIESTVNAAIAMAVKGGTVVVVGGPKGRVGVDLPLLQEFQVKLQGAATYLAEDFDVAAEIIASGAVDTDEFITAKFPLTDAAAAFDSLATGDEVKIVVTGEGFTEK
ncbi:2-desacetyl-2-hydroxyethyl bacteriochlorophyllide A dehydrogenase [Rhodococcus sp. 27YEA15]|uniref:zinc-dependent alcohol dehydrogenase n=1 Tax=Rhodococcus sp. 27YEA15 TaxID=3156259 RepID=UPI003C7B5228